MCELNPSRHFYLYAKGWYRRDNLIDDMKTLQSEYTGVDKENLTRYQALERVIELAYHSFSGDTTRLIWVEKLALTNTIEESFKACLSALACAHIDTFGNLGSPDPDILPLAKEVEE